MTPEFRFGGRARGPVNAQQKTTTTMTILNRSFRSVLAAAAVTLLLTSLSACQEPGTAAAGKDAQASGATSTSNAPTVVLTTNQGRIEIELYPDKAPSTVENFLAYVDSRYYDGTIFHRVIKDFMIQGGGFDANGRQKPTNPPIKNEADNGLKNERGTIAMARTSAPHSATAQFFINVKDNDFLNFTEPTARGYGYTVFGKVTAGMDVVDKIQHAAVAPSGRFPNAPV